MKKRKRLKPYLRITHIIDKEMMIWAKDKPGYETRVCDRSALKIVAFIQNNYRRRKK